MYVSLVRIVGRLFSAYGGFSAFFLSPYVHISAILSVLYAVYGELLQIEKLIIEIIPSILGFSIGAYAIMFSAIGERVLEVISKREPGDVHSPLSELSASFGYYVLIQACAVIISVFALLFDFYSILTSLNPELISYRDEWVIIVNILKSFFLFYSILLTGALSLEIYRVSTLRER